MIDEVMVLGTTEDGKWKISIEGDVSTYDDPVEAIGAVYDFLGEDPSAPTEEDLADPRCMHGKEPTERCTECAVFLLASMYVDDRQYTQLPYMECFRMVVRDLTRFKVSCSEMTSVLNYALGQYTRDGRPMRDGR